MNGFLIVGISVALVVALLRLWFRWFSRRPLSTTDDYAVTVDSSVDDRPAGAGPPVRTDRVERGESAAVSGPAMPAPEVAAPGHAPAPLRRNAVGHAIPHQRSVVDRRPVAGHPDAATGAAGERPAAGPNPAVEPVEPLWQSGR